MVSLGRNRTGVWRTKCHPVAEDFLGTEPVIDGGLSWAQRRPSDPHRGCPRRRRRTVHLASTGWLSTQRSETSTNDPHRRLPRRRLRRVHLWPLLVGSALHQSDIDVPVMVPPRIHRVAFTMRFFLRSHLAGTHACICHRWWSPSFLGSQSRT